MNFTLPKEVGWIWLYHARLHPLGIYGEHTGARRGLRDKWQQGSGLGFSWTIVQLCGSKFLVQASYFELRIVDIEILDILSVGNFRAFCLIIVIMFHLSDFWFLFIWKVSLYFLKLRVIFSRWKGNINNKNIIVALFFIPGPIVGT